MPAILRLGFLGGFSVTLAAAPHAAAPEPMAGFISAKSQALLAYLACAPRRHTRDALAALFWPDMSDSDAKTNLRQALSNLKKLCEPWLLIERDSVAFDGAAPHVLDVAEFQRAAATNTLNGRAQAAALYGGPLLHGLVLKDAPEFESWLVTERERLHLLARGNLRALAQARAQGGDADGAVAALRGLVALDPLDESAQRDVMLALARNGQRAAALAQFEACCRTLKRELGVEPEQQTQALRDRIRASEQRLALPRHDMPFVGRENETALIEGWLRDASCRLVTITGMGGIGKTCLALHVAERAGRTMLGGACFVSLDTAGSLPAVAAAVLTALALDPSPNLGTQTQVQGYLRDKELLLVLDNAETVTADCAAWIAEMIATAPDVKFLVTSRQRLNLRAERLCVLEALPCLGGDSSSARLFQQAAQYAGMTQSLPPRQVEAICCKLEGHPLAIVLAAAWLQQLSLAEIDSELQRGLERLSSQAFDADARHQNLTVVIEQSWQLLNAAERSVLTRLSVFAGGWSRHAAEAVARATMPVLASLTMKSLIRQDVHGHYSQHELLRRFALAQLSRLPDGGLEARHAHRAYFLDLLTRLEPALKDNRARSAIGELESCVDNLSQAWRAALSELDEAAVTSMAGPMEALFVFLEIACRFGLGASLFAEAARATEGAAGLDELHSNMLFRHGWFLFRLGQFDAGNALIERSMHIFERLGKREHMGANHYGAGDYAAALRLFEASRDVYEKLGDCWGMCGSFNNMGQVLTAMGDYAGAEANLKMGLDMAEAIHSPYQSSHLLESLASLRLTQGDVDDAAVFAEQALQAARDHMQPFVVISALQTLADIASRQGRHAEAQTRLSEAVDLARSLGDIDAADRMQAGLASAVDQPRDPA